MNNRGEVPGARAEGENALPHAPVSVIVSTYNRPEALAAVLNGLAAQTERDFEIVVADDGSAPVTAAVSAGYQSRLAAPLRHVWQEDRGFRAAAARNRAVSQSRGDYLIFLDGDCIPRRDFIAAHRRLAEPGWFVAGNRVLLSEDLTRQALQQDWPVGDWSWRLWWPRWRRGEINRLFPLLALPDGGWRKLRPSRWRGARTCNLGVWRQDFERVNGFDERYQGWGHEDADLAVRLIRAGVRRKSGQFAAAVLHLWHPDNNRARLADNERRLAAVIRGDHIRAAPGLDQYASQGHRSHPL